MKHNFLIFAAALAFCCAFVSCNGPKTQSYRSILENRTDVCMFVGPRDMIDFTKGAVQTQYNTVTHRYRAGVCIQQKDSTSGRYIETMDEFFTVVLDTIPISGIMTNAKVYLRSVALSRSYDASFEICKIEDGLAWMWDEKQKLGVVARVGARQ